MPQEITNGVLNKGHMKGTGKDEVSWVGGDEDSRSYIGYGELSGNPRAWMDYMP